MPADPDCVHVDLKVTSTNDLVAAIETLSKTVEEREKSHTPEQIDLLDKQLTHIDKELIGQTDTSDTAVPLSLEHLELYEAFLLRVTFKEGDQPSLHERQKGLLCKVETAIKRHPLAGAPRSGDRSDGAMAASYFKVPWGRRRQTAALIYLNLVTGPALIFFFVGLFLYLVPFGWVLFCGYVAWVSYDNYTRPVPAPNRVSQKWRHTSFYCLFRDYFPIRIIKANQDSKEFAPTKNFLFAYHPHGVQSSGAFAFASAACGVDHLFPGLDVSVQTLSINYKIPLTRENLIGLGLGDASKECLTTILKGHKGYSAVLVTGGAQESLYAHPYKSRVFLRTRAGFIKIALETGASLVPVWGFGENNLYDNLAENNDHVRSIQRRIQSVISFAPLLITGRGVFSYSGGLLPHRRPISAVVGEPMHFDQPEPKPSQERIAEVAQMYRDRVVALFNTYKDIYDPKAEPIEFI